MPTYHMAWRQKWPYEIRAEFALSAQNKHEARTISAKYARLLGGSFHFQGGSE